MAARSRDARYHVRPEGHGPLRRAGSSGGASQAPRPAALHVRRNQRPLPMMMRVQVVGRQHGQVGWSGEVAHHHLAPRAMVHGELAVPQPVGHWRLDLLSAGRPLDRVAGAQIDHAAFSRFVIRQLQFAAHVLGQQTQHRGLRRRRHGRELVEKDDDQVAVFGEPPGIARPGHRQQAHAVRRGHRKAAEVLRFTNRSEQDHDLAFHACARESGLQALGELGLADAGKPVMCIGMRACRPMAIS